MLEQCEGIGGIPQLAVSRGLSSGGNLDKRTYVDLGNKEAQDAAMHYLGVCFVKVVILQPSCITTGLPPYFNAKVNYDKRHEHRKEDLPRIKFCGKVAARQNDLRRFYLGEQPLGTWAGQIRPWTTLVKSKGTCQVNMDQHTTGSRGSHGVQIRNPTEIMANRRILLTPFERKRCSGHHQHASVCNKELPMAAQYTPKMQSLFVESVQIAHDLLRAT
eukprot:582940-Pyramimonas_sp.AAC.1